MSIIERMFETLNQKGLKSVDLADVLGVGTGQISTWKKRNTDPPAKYIALICEFLNITPEYLLTGEEKSNDKSNYLSSEDRELLKMIHELPADVRAEIKGEIKGYLKRMREESASDGLRDVSGK